MSAASITLTKPEAEFLQSLLEQTLEYLDEEPGAKEQYTITEELLSKVDGVLNPGGES